MVRVLTSVTFVLLLAVQATAQTDLSGEWVGPLEFHDSRGRLIIPTLTTVKVDGDKLSGTWIAQNKKSSGSFTGSINNKGRVLLNVVFHSGGEIEHPDGKIEIVGRERCEGSGDFAGEVMRSGVIRLTARVIGLSGFKAQMRGRACEDMRNLTWVLQRPTHQPLRVPPP